MTEFETCLISINKNILLGHYERSKSDINSAHFLLDDIMKLQGLAVSDIEKYRCVDFIASMPNELIFLISRYAFELYKNQEYDIASYAFLRATQREFQKGNDTSVNNLVYMLRRQEGNLSSEFSISNMVEMLQAGLENHKPHSIVNLALLFVLKSGKDDDWKIADEVIMELKKSEDSLNDMITWWSDIENVGLIECLVVHLLLLKNEILQESIFGSKKEIIDKLIYENIYVPEWI